MMKDANAPFTIMGRDVESQATFVASDTGTGTVEMSFTFRRSLLSNDLTLVAFEKLFDAKGNLIGAHEDINDEAQTVTIKKTNPERLRQKATPLVIVVSVHPMTGAVMILEAVCRKLANKC